MAGEHSKSNAVSAEDLADFKRSATTARERLAAAMAKRSGVVDEVNHPSHYTGHPSGVECIQVTEHMGFCLGNAVKYIWRAGRKGDALRDLKKARWYIEREIVRRQAEGVANDD